MKKAELTQQACEIATKPQMRKLAHLLSGEWVTGITATAAGFDLPPGYLNVRIDYDGRSPIYGGISPEGDLST